MKEFDPIVLTFEGTSIFSNDEHPSNKLFSIDVIEFGIAISFNDEQSLNELGKIVVIVDGMIIFLSEENPSNALFEIVVMVLGRIMVFICLIIEYSIFVISCLDVFIIISVNEIHSSNELF